MRVPTAAPTLVLAPCPPFDARPILRYYERSPLEPLDRVVDGAWRRAARIGGRPVLFEAAPDGPPDDPRVTVRVLAAGRPAGAAADSRAADPRAGDQTDASDVLKRVGAGVEYWWRLGQTAGAPDDLARADPVLGRLLGRLHGARSPLMPSPFECLIWAILGQQITLAFAYKLKRAVVEAYGDVVEHGDRQYRLFPEAARLAAADPDDLRALQLSRQKSDYLRGLAALEAEGRIDWSALATMPSDAATRALTALRGVGRWTAEYVLMRGLGHPDVIPAADVGLQTAIGRAYGFGRKATEGEVRALAERWAPHRSHAAFAWWWSLSAGAP